MCDFFKINFGILEDPCGLFLLAGGTYAGFPIQRNLDKT
jgi:hypothetical protein